MKTLFYLSLTIIFLLSSCGMKMEKRRYNRGFHISSSSIWKSSKKTNEQKEKDNERIDFVVQHEDLAHESVKLIDPKVTLSEIQEIEDLTFVQEQEEIVDVINTIKQSVESEDDVLLNSTQEYLTAEEPTITISSIDQPITPINGDSYLYLIAGLTALSAFGLVKVNRKRTLNLARWARSNKPKSLALLITAQFGLAFVGYQIGSTLSNMGYEISENTQYVASTIGAIAFLGLMVNERRKTQHPDVTGFFRKKVGHIVIAVSLLASTMGIGNGESVNSQTSPIGYFVEQTASVQNVNYDLPTIDELNDSASSASGDVRGILALWIILGILLTALFAVLTCMTFCSYGALGWLAVLGSLLLLFLFNWGMSKWREKELNRT